MPRLNVAYVCYQPAPYVDNHALTCCPAAFKGIPYFYDRLKIFMVFTGGYHNLVRILQRAAVVKQGNHTGIHV